MNRIVTMAAVIAALSTPAMAELKIGGDFEWNYQNNDGATTTDVDADLNFKPSMTLDDGTKVSADININEDGDDDGGNSMTIAKGIWSIDMGDTSSATDAIDDKTDWGKVLTNGSPSTDHAALLTIKPIDGLKVMTSFAADSNYGTTAGSGYAYSAAYTMGPITVGAGKLENDAGSSETVSNISGGVGDIALAYEKHTATTAAGVDTDTTTMAAKYTIGNTKLLVELMEAESANVVSSDETTFGVHQTIAPGLVAFVETTDDEKTASEQTTAIGLTMAF